jgi:glutathione peroxidase
MISISGEVPVSRIPTFPAAAGLAEIIIGLVLVAPPGASTCAQEKGQPSVYAFTMKDIDGNDVSLSRYKGKVILIINVASFCGYTKQYAGLESLYRRYGEKGLSILAFPANNFGSQEPGTDAEIKDFCATKFDVTFDLFSKISVKGSDQHPLYAYLTSPETNPRFSGDVRWNFTKYLVDRTGNIVAKFDSRVEPLAEELTGAIENALSRK